jgi:hypothetical protein
MPAELHVLVIGIFRNKLKEDGLAAPWATFICRRYTTGNESLMRTTTMQLLRVVGRLALINKYIFITSSK